MLHVRILTARLQVPSDSHERSHAALERILSRPAASELAWYAFSVPHNVNPSRDPLKHA